VKIPSTQIQILSLTDKEIKEHMKRLGYSSKTDFLVEVVITEWLKDHEEELKQFNDKLERETTQPPSL